MKQGARFSIAADHPCLVGHFPGHPVVPGVLLLEQAVAAIEAVQGPLQVLRLPQVKFMRPLLPGESAWVEFEPTDTGTGGRRWRFRVLRGDGEMLASGEVGVA
jgi:3-hydroxymyristoyl/3-hydroxydecanoyl-(acyl carrier protein) dehydratase